MESHGNIRALRVGSGTEALAKPQHWDAVVRGAWWLLASLAVTGPVRAQAAPALEFTQVLTLLRAGTTSETILQILGGGCVGGAPIGADDSLRLVHASTELRVAVAGRNCDQASPTRPASLSAAAVARALEGRYRWTAHGEIRCPGEAAEPFGPSHEMVTLRPSVQGPAVLDVIDDSYGEAGLREQEVTDPTGRFYVTATIQSILTVVRADSITFRSVVRSVTRTRAGLLSRSVAERVVVGLLEPTFEESGSIRTFRVTASSTMEAKGRALLGIVRVNREYCPSIVSIQAVRE